MNPALLEAAFNTAVERAGIAPSKNAEILRGNVRPGNVKLGLIAEMAAVADEVDEEVVLSGGSFAQRLEGPPQSSLRVD